MKTETLSHKPYKYDCIHLTFFITWKESRRDNSILLVQGRVYCDLYDILLGSVTAVGASVGILGITQTPSGLHELSQTLK